MPFLPQRLPTHHWVLKCISGTDYTILLRLTLLISKLIPTLSSRLLLVELARKLEIYMVAYNRIGTRNWLSLFKIHTPVGRLNCVFMT